MDQAHTVPAEDTTTGLNHRKLLMWTFLASECLFFGALISNYLIGKDRDRGRSNAPRDFRHTVHIRQHVRPPYEQPDDGPGPCRTTTRR